VTALALELANRTRTALTWWLLGLLGMAGYVVGAYTTLSDVEDLSALYEEFSPALRDVIGEVDISTMDGWLHVEFLAWVPLIMAIYAGIYASAAVSREVEQRTVDFVLGLPVSRTQFIASRLAVGFWNLLVISVSVFVFLVIAVAISGETLSPDRYALALTNAFLVGAALMAAYVAVAAAVDEQSRVTGITLGLTLVAFIATAGLRAADAPEALRWFTPFEHYHSAEAMSGDGLPLLPLVLLLSLAVAAATAAIYWYNRRDIAI
jgi:ABC-2 type transport system permease protein